MSPMAKVMLQFFWDNISMQDVTAWSFLDSNSIAKQKFESSSFLLALGLLSLKLAIT